METLEAVELKESKARRHPDNNLDFFFVRLVGRTSVRPQLMARSSGMGASGHTCPSILE